MRLDGVVGAVRQDSEAFTPEMAELYGRMSDVSEDRWSAGWSLGCEYDLWRDALAGESSYRDADALREILALSDRLGGWVVWIDSDSPLDGGAAFVPLDAWRAEYARVLAARRERA